MEKNNELLDACKKEVSKRNFNSSMTTSKSDHVYLWRPNNYRRGVKIRGFDNSGFNQTGFLPRSTIPYNKCVHTKVVSINFSEQLTIQIFKKSLIAIWSQRVVNKRKEVFRVTGSLSAIDKQILDKKSEITGLLDDSIRLVVSRLGLNVSGKPYWIRKEDWTSGESLVDELPRDVIIHSDHWKKVYDKGVECLEGLGEDENYLKRLIDNDVLRRNLPEIVRELAFNRLLTFDIYQWCEEYLKALDDVFHFESVIRFLPFEKRLLVSDFVFERFGGVDVEA